MEHSPDEFEVGRWGCRSCLGRQVEGGYLDPSESNFFSLSKCAICSSMTVFKRRYFNSFREQLSRKVIGSQVTCRSVMNKFEGGSLLFPLMSRKWTWCSLCIWNIIKAHYTLWRGQYELSHFQMGSEGSYTMCITKTWSMRYETERWGWEEKITRWFQLTLENANEHMVVQCPLRSVAMRCCSATWSGIFHLKK